MEFTLEIHIAEKFVRRACDYSGILLKNQEDCVIVKMDDYRIVSERKTYGIYELKAFYQVGRRQEPTS